MIQVRYRRQLWQILTNQGIIGDLAEIGVAEGNFSRDMLAWPLDWIPKLYMVDRWECTPSVQGDSAMPQEWHDKNMKEALEKVSTLYSHRAIFLRGGSVEMAKKVPDRSLALVYIDGDHSYNGVSADLIAWGPKVVERGIIALHDYENPDYGVKEAVKDYCSGRFKIHPIPEDKPEDAGAWFQITRR